MNNYILTTDLSAYESELKELRLWNRLKKYLRDSCSMVVSAIARKNSF